MKTVIIGSPGTGKSTFARALQAKRQVPLLHLDSLWHKGDYSAAAEQVFQTELAAFMVEHEAFIVDGNYSSSLPQRLAMADQVIWLKEAKWLRLARVLKRTLAFKLNPASRPEMPIGFAEKFDSEYLAFLQLVWHYDKVSLPKIEELLSDFAGEIIVLSGQKAKRAYLSQEVEDA